MNAADLPRRASATFRATVDFPDPVPPAIPMMSGFTWWHGRQPRCDRDVRYLPTGMEVPLSRFLIGSLARNVHGQKLAISGGGVNTLHAVACTWLSR